MIHLWQVQRAAFERGLWVTDLGDAGLHVIDPRTMRILGHATRYTDLLEIINNEAIHSAGRFAYLLARVRRAVGL